MLGRIAIDCVTGRSFDEMELLIARLNVQSGHHKLSEVGYVDLPAIASGAHGDRVN